MAPHRIRLLLATLFALVSVQCSSKSCPSPGYCVYTIHFDFAPAIAAHELITFTVTGGDTSYTATYSPDKQTGTSLELHAQTDASDGGGFVVASADLSFETPVLISYAVVADGKTVATGTEEPQYQHYTRGSENCKQACTTAYLTVPVTP